MPRPKAGRLVLGALAHGPIATGAWARAATDAKPDVGAVRQGRYGARELRVTEMLGGAGLLAEVQAGFSVFEPGVEQIGIF